MLPYRDTWITRAVLIIFFLLVIGYAYFEAQGLLFGPTITVGSSITEVHDPFVKIQGKAARISSLSMNGKQVSVTEDGAFSEPYLLVAGDNRIVLDARDTYGRTSRKVINIVYVPSATSSNPLEAGSEQATSSVQTSVSSTISTSTTPVAP